MPTTRRPFSGDIPDDTVTVKIDGKEFRFWEEVEIIRAIDVHPSLGLTAPFEASRKDFREIFRPFTYRDIEVYLGRDRLFNGTMLGPDPKVTPQSRTVSVAAYSRAAVLLDSCVPASLVPLQVNGLKLVDIARNIASAFGLDVIFTELDTVKFRKVRPDISSKAQDFLVTLAQQRGLLVTSNEDGDLVFQKSASAGRPVARLRPGSAPLTTVSAKFNHQDYYSEITGFVPTRAGRVGSKYTEQNPNLTTALRAMSFRLDDTEKGDVRGAVKAKMGRMFGNMVSYAVTLPTWRDSNGDLWRPNTTVTLLAPDAMVYSETELLVREVSLRQNATEQTAALELVLPGAFAGETPSSLPWDEPI